MVMNRSGRFIDPSLDTVDAALASIAASAPADLRLDPINAPGKDSYPITTATYMCVYRNQTDHAKAVALVRLLWWSTHDAQSANEPLHYGRLPSSITARSEQLIKSITCNGSPVPLQ
jgi:phosphate transport system substrate-binding protein